MSCIPLRLVLSLPTSVGGMDLERTGSTEALPTLLKDDPRELQTSRLLRGGRQKIANGNILLHGEWKMIRCSTSVIQKEGRFCLETF